MTESSGFIIVSNKHPKQAESSRMGKNNVRNDQMPLAPDENSKMDSDSGQTGRRQKQKRIHFTFLVNTKSREHLHLFIFFSPTFNVGSVSGTI
jgi:hypothetical protein